MSEFFAIQTVATPEGYHMKEIAKGRYGEFSKIEEVFQEAKDCDEQGNPLMVLNELSTLLTVVDAYANRYGMDLTDLMSMATAKTRQQKLNKVKVEQFDTLGEK